jgi:hypothetical protein
MSTAGPVIASLLGVVASLGANLDRDNIDDVSYIPCG